MEKGRNLMEIDPGLVHDLVNFLDKYADADHDGGRYIPNEAMKLQRSLELALEEEEDVRF